ncbi:MAG: GAF domain-containing protein [Myxococcaceae bacterium]|nr:GAF domain-containing protein [Myxococcaceae bacterium]
MSRDSKPELVLRPRVAAALQRLRDSRDGGAVGVIGEIVSQLLGCEEHALLVLGEGGARLQPIAAMGLTPQRLESLLAPEGIIGQVARHGVPYLVGRTSSVGALAHEAGLTACIAIRSGRQVRGVLALFRMLPQKRSLTGEDLELLDVISEEGAPAFSDPRGGAFILQPPSTEPLPSRTAPGLRALFLQPGGVVTAAQPTEVTTILGSCVSVCLWDEHLRLGGMNHFLLPTAPRGQLPCGRHGEAAIPMLLRDLERLGSQRRNLRAKVFGGAHVAGAPAGGAGPTLGQRNAELARRLLAEAGIPIIAEDLGGRVGRKLRFRTEDGLALVKTLEGG